MQHWVRVGAIGMIAAAILCSLEAANAGPRPHAYLFRGLADIFSTGMDALTDELKKNGVYATSHSHTNWKPIADRAAADYKVKKEGPIILIGHSLGADAVMEMADYLGDKGVPVALVIPFDGTQSFPVSGNVARVVNFTQRDYAYMRPGPGFHGSLSNVDLSSNRDIGHLNIDKSPELHARVISEVLSVINSRRPPATASTKPDSLIAPQQPHLQNPATAVPAPERNAEQSPDNGALPIIQPERNHESKRSGAQQPALPPTKPVSSPQRTNPPQIPD